MSSNWPCGQYYTRHPTPPCIKPSITMKFDSKTESLVSGLDSPIPQGVDVALPQVPLILYQFSRLASHLLLVSASPVQQSRVGRQPVADLVSLTHLGTPRYRGVGVLLTPSKNRVLLVGGKSRSLCLYDGCGFVCLRFAGLCHVESVHCLLHLKLGSPQLVLCPGQLLSCLGHELIGIAEC